MKPILRKIDAIDADNPLTLEFVWEGNQAFGNVCIVRDNLTNDIVYLQSHTTMQLKHTIEAHSLQNGRVYNVSIATIDSESTISEYSNPMLIYCISTPLFDFENIQRDQIVRNSTYKVMMNYSQKDNEPLQSFDITLYDASKSQIQTSTVLFSVEDLTYTLTNLEDNRSYFIKATGKTLNGLNIETEYIPFTVNYIQPAIYSIMTLENIKDEGYIKIQSNVKSIDCHTLNNPIFIDGEYIDLRNDILTIDKDFSLDNDFIINLSGHLLDGLIMQSFNNENSCFSVYLRKGAFDVTNNIEKAYIELLSENGITTYRCTSQYVDPPQNNDNISIWITKRNGLYSVEMKVGE